MTTPPSTSSSRLTAYEEAAIKKKYYDTSPQYHEWFYTDQTIEERAASVRTSLIAARQLRVSVSNKQVLAFLKGPNITTDSDRAYLDFGIRFATSLGLRLPDGDDVDVEYDWYELSTEEVEQLQFPHRVTMGKVTPAGAAAYGQLSPSQLAALEIFPLEELAEQGQLEPAHLALLKELPRVVFKGQRGFRRLTADELLDFAENGFDDPRNYQLVTVPANYSLRDRAMASSRCDTEATTTSTSSSTQSRINEREQAAIQSAYADDYRVEQAREQDSSRRGRSLAQRAASIHARMVASGTLRASITTQQVHSYLMRPDVINDDALAYLSLMGGLWRDAGFVLVGEGAGAVWRLLTPSEIAQLPQSRQAAMGYLTDAGLAAFAQLTPSQLTALETMPLDKLAEHGQLSNTQLAALKELPARVFSSQPNLRSRLTATELRRLQDCFPMN